MPESVSTGGSSSKLSQFGIYKSFDARTEEFMKLSKRRQIRQGCACAVLSTIITVVIVAVILLIYEYAVAKSRIVQRRKGEIYDSSNVTNDTPVADRLDRSYFGFDQDYFEQMPILVNALQENSYIDPDISAPSKLDKRGRLVKTHSKHYEIAPIRRTSPRPFIFEYRSPTPSPFHKMYNSRSWVENYRNAQRMKNLEQVIKYLEKTINAKFGDLYSFPSSTHIAFSGLYVQPGDTKVESSSPSPDQMIQGSNRVQTVNKGHQLQQSDLLFSYKPESPGDVNMLADAPLKFALPPPLSLTPMFRPGPNTKGCVGIRCSKQNKSPNLLNIVAGSAEIKTTNPSLFDKANTFSVIMNLIPMTTSPSPLYSNVLTTTMTPLDQIYFTTSRPEFQFKRKSTGPIFPKRRYYRRRKPKAQKKASSGFVLQNSNSPAPDVGGANMILTVKVFPKADGSTSTTESPPVFTPNVLNSTQVEDYHAGSSGIIPVSLRPTTTQLPQVTLTPFFDETSSSSEIRAWSSTNPPDILKFGQEDAKVPDHYRRIQEIQDAYRNYQPEIDRRNSKESYRVTTEKIMKHESPSSIEVGIKDDVNIEDEEESTTAVDLNSDETIEEPEPSTTVKTYVPQINGHSRHININSRNINNWLTDSSEKRKSKLEIKVTGHRTYVPTYVEIRRSRTRSENNN